MSRKLYSARNVLSTVGHYSGQLATGAGAFMLGPFLAVGGTAYAAGKWALTIALCKHVFENELEPHPDIHKYSPNLGKMVKELYRTSGLDEGAHPVYSFRPKEQERDDKAGKVLEGLSHMRKIPNAAAFHLEKPVIMISESLLKLLEDDEEHAVLAHEFAHAAALHQHLSMPHSFLGNAARLTGTLAGLVEFVKTGFIGIPATLAATIGGTMIAAKAHKDSGVVFKKDDELSLPEKHRKIKTLRLSGLFGTAAGIGTATYFNAQFLPVFAAAQSIGISAKLLEKSFSRSLEYQADKGAVTFGADPLSLIRALRKIDSVMKSGIIKEWGNYPMPEKGRLSTYWNHLTSTHPQLERRIARLSDMAREKGISEEAINSAVNDPVDISHADEIPRNIIKNMAVRLNGRNAYSL